jgi:tetratricopeptide (TPR) repeat protein
MYAESEIGASEVANDWARLGDYDRALDLCSKVLSQDPNLYSSLYNCGNIELMAGRYGESARLLQRAVNVSPQLAAPRHFLGRALLLDGNNDEALPFLRQAVTMDPSIYDYHYWLGRSLQQSGDTVGARREYLQVLSINGDSMEAKTGLAELGGK